MLNKSKELLSHCVDVVISLSLVVKCATELVYLAVKSLISLIFKKKEVK